MFQICFLVVLVGNMLVYTGISISGLVYVSLIISRGKIAGKVAEYTYLWFLAANKQQQMQDNIRGKSLCASCKETHNSR